MDLKNGIIEINGITINKDTDNNKNLIDTTKEYKVAFFDDEYNVRIDFSDYTNKIWSIKYVLADNNKDFAFLEKKQEELTKKIENALGIVSKKCGKHLDAFDLDWGYISVQVAKQISPKPPICFIEISYFKPRKKRN